MTFLGDMTAHVHQIVTVLNARNILICNMSFKHDMLEPFDWRYGLERQRQKEILPDDNIARALFKEAEYLRYDIRNGVRLTHAQQLRLIDATADLAHCVIYHQAASWSDHITNQDVLPVLRDDNQRAYTDALFSETMETAVAKAVLLTIWKEVRPSVIEAESRAISGEQVAEAIARAINQHLDDTPKTRAEYFKHRPHLRADSESIKRIMDSEASDHFNDTRSPKNYSDKLLSAAQSVHEDITQQLKEAAQRRP